MPSPRAAPSPRTASSAVHAVIRLAIPPARRRTTTRRVGSTRSPSSAASGSNGIRCRSRSFERVVAQQHCVFGEHTVQIHERISVAARSAVIDRLELLDTQLATRKCVRKRRQVVEQSPAPQQMVSLPGGASPGDRDLARGRPSAVLVVVARDVPVVLEAVIQPLSPRPIHLTNPRLHPRQQL